METTSVPEEPTSNRLPVSFYWLPALILLFGSILILSLDLDRRVSSLFFSDNGEWNLADNGLFVFLYDFGPIPVFICAGLAIGLGLFRFRDSQFRFHRTLCLATVLLLALGPGLVINGIFKEHYGRPRPRNVTDFGGNQKFVPLLVYNPDGSGKSFPSGHASMGFFWLGFVPWFAAAFPHRRTWMIFLTAGLLHGGLMGLGRIAQGGHFLGDVLWSAGFVYFIATALLVLFHPKKP